MDLIYANLSPTVALALFAASFVGSFITVSMGIGGGAMLLAVMATLVPPAALIPVHGVIQFGSNILRAVIMAPHTHWPPVAAFAVGSVIGVGLGGALVIDLPGGAVQVGVGLFILWSIARRPPQWLIRWPAITGGISSFLTMFFGATGVFVSSYVLSLRLGREAHVATQAVLMTLQHLLKVIMFGVLGFSFGPWLGFLAAMIAAGFIGTLIGRQILIRMGDQVFARVLNAILIILALRLIWQGSFALVGW